MSDPAKDLTRYVQETINIRLEARRAKLREECEPKLRAELGGAASDCLRFLLESLPAGGSQGPEPLDMPGLKLRLSREFWRLAQARLESARELLGQALQQQAQEFGDIVSLNGLLWDRPADLAPGMAERAYQALAEATAASCADFTGRVGLALSQRAKETALRELAASWRARLESIAVTLLHQAVNQLNRETLRAA